MKPMDAKWRAIVFWGALWGILESTVGALLHLLPLNIGWIVWTPMAFGCLLGAYSAVRSAVSMLYVAAIAAAFKLTNLFLPIRMDMVVNPAISIVLEALALGALIKLAGGIPRRLCTRAALILSANTIWRLFYLLYLSITPVWMREISVLRSQDTVIVYLLVENVLTSLISVALSYAPFARLFKRAPVSSHTPTALLAGMCVANIVLALIL